MRRSGGSMILESISATLRDWWANPLFSHARRLNPLPLDSLRRAAPIGAGALALISILTWAINWRAVGAALVGLSFGVILTLLLVAPAVGARRVAGQMQTPGQDPRQLRDVAAGDVAWGLALAALWQLRWLVVLALVVTPVLVIGVLRIELSDFATWRASTEALGDAGVGDPSARLLPGGRIPFFRLAVRALTAGLLPWALLPVLTTLGVMAALSVYEPSLSLLAALLGGAVGTAVAAAIWNVIASAPLLAGPLEIIRVMLLGGIFGGLGLLARWSNGQNARLLSGSAQPVNPEPGREV
jgi:hypothetical protein